MANKSSESPKTLCRRYHTTKKSLIIVPALVAVLVGGLFFGLTGCNDDNPTPEDNEPNHTHEYGGWEYDSIYHWRECECGEIAEKAEHTLGEMIIGENGYYQKCSVCGYATAQVMPIATSIEVSGADNLVIYYSTTGDGYSTSINLRETLTVIVYDQAGVEYTGNGGSEYTLSTIDTDIISLDDTEGIVSALAAGEAHVTITSVANENIFTDITITVTDIETEVESISVEQDELFLAWGETTDPLEVTFTPNNASVQTYNVSSVTNDGLFTFNEKTNTFTHSKINTGRETFKITASDTSHNATCEITLECDPVIDEPYDVEWVDFPTEIEKGTILNLDDYVKLDYDHTGQDEHEYEDDACTFTYATNNTDAISIDSVNNTATFVGTGGSVGSITVTAYPNHKPDSPVFKMSDSITITQAVTNVVFSSNPLKLYMCPNDDIDTGELEITLEPEDYYPKNVEVSWSISQEDEEILVITPDESGTKCSVTPLSDGEATITVNIGDSEVGSCQVVVKDYRDCVFSTDSWDLINEVATNGVASRVYNLEDVKDITLTSDDEDVEDEVITVRIIDFDHDELSTDAENYNSNYNNGETAAMTIEMENSLSSSRRAPMCTPNTVSSNVGGWDECYMRTTYLPSIFTLLPEDLQSIIKTVDKIATMGSGNSQNTITSKDTLFLLSEVEVDGTASSGYSSEGTEYAYYKEHSEKSDLIKCTNGTDSGYAWWLRSPVSGSTTNFRYIGGAGSMNGSAANNSWDVSFAFCV